ncbi:cellular communication network factor 1, like 2 [Pygocentrus nattereri]|uniref:Cellular communication network factor 1, like 2 n=1 Tax=Pygocentrus nattereri TaxID=42514 RepID=A0A3B4CYW6_PYGNA|nr:cellular communication network factor 1, like 2 [Pygocentrus nattereri]
MYSLRSVRRHTALGALLLILCAPGKVAGGCSGPCSCPPSPPSCPLGVSWVLDECGCCKVCAQQFNQDCGPDKPCDHIKGLRCHLGAGGDPQRGLCRADAQGRPCEFGGRVFQHGEDFQPSCEHQCSCMDGVVGCMPLCPHHLPLPVGHCANPHLRTPPGRCCQEWVCDDDNHISEDPHYTQHSQHHTNHISKLLQAPSGNQARGERFQEWASLPVPFSECFPQTTEWTQCSSSCGFGISSRVTNRNPQCKLVRETRLCQIRECDITPTVRKGKECRRTVKSREPEQVTFAGCSTIKLYRLRTCGSCVDGRCCRPSQTRTVHLRFQCPDGESITRSIMWIQRCRCRKSYCSMDIDSSAPAVSLHNDIHTFSP